MLSGWDVIFLMYMLTPQSFETTNFFMQLVKTPLRRQMFYETKGFIGKSFQTAAILVKLPGSYFGLNRPVHFLDYD